MPGDFGEWSSVPARARGRPITASKASWAVPPARSSVGVSVERSRTVDSRPTVQGPPSKTNETSSPKLFATCRASVGLNRLDLFALGAATGNSATANSRRACGEAGMRTATVSSPALTSLESALASVRGKTILSGPGQSVSATRSARSLNCAYCRAVATSGTCTISGLKLGRFFAA